MNTSNLDNDISLIEEEREASSALAYTPIQSKMNFIVEADNIPSDPGASGTGFWNQWHHTGPYGLNTLKAWEDYTGEGVRVGVLDDGFRYTHSELSENFRTDLDYDVLGNDNNSINDSNDNHGTWVSLVIGADDNGARDVGVAFDADLVGIRRGFNGEGTTQDTLDAFQYALDNDFDVFNNSWGISSAFGDNKKINFTGTDTSAVIDKFEDLVEFGRSGLGTNIVFSAGNDREEGSSANYKNYQNSPYSITVGAINNSGTYAYFSEAGSNLLVTAPGQSIRISNAADNGSASSISGTSFSAPAVSGVIALILEANDALGYRDVQEILALSARQIDGDGIGWANEGWQTNGADNFNGGGLHFSHDYGYGLVDAQSAVRLAESWNTQQTFSNMTVIPPVSGSSLNLPATGTVTTTINVTDDIDIEHVLIDLDLSHGRAGDLKIVLVSPEGTESILAYNIENGSYTSRYGITGIDFEFSSVAHWGESSQGVWTLRFEDLVGGNGGVLHDWSLSFLGGEQRANDTYFYTDEFSTAAGARLILNDTDGGIDTINASAVTNDITIDLTNGGIIAGNDFTIVGEAIENVIAGDGNDALTGNNNSNHIHGGRGDDIIYGSLGNDTLDGGLGSDIASFDFNIGDYLIGIVDAVTFSLNHVAQSFTDILSNFEFFRFNEFNYSHAELTDYVNTQGGAPITTKLVLGGNGINHTLVHDENGTFNHDGEELGRSGDTNNLLRVVRETATINASVLNPSGDEIDSVVLNNNNLTNVVLTGFRDAKVVQIGATHNTNISLTNVMKGEVQTGSGDDKITAVLQDIATPTNFSKWVIKTNAGNDDITIGGAAAQSSTKIFTGDGDDIVTINVAIKNVIYGGSGSDQLTAGNEKDNLYGEDGNDILNGNGGNDKLLGQNGDDILNGGNGIDLLDGGAGSDILNGGDGRDKLEGGTGDDTLNGGEGNDTLRGNADNDTLNGDAGNDTIQGDAGDDILNGGDGIDLIRGGDGDDIVHGDADSDKIYGDSGNDTLYGDSGFDALYGGGGNDILFGGADNDRLYGQNGNDRLDGGAGNDIISAGRGTDILIGGDGADRLYGSGGSDIFALTVLDGSAEQFYNYTFGIDVINITDILSGFDSGIDNINDFVKFVGRSNGTAELRISEDGNGAFVTAAVINSQFNGRTVDDLFDNGTLIADISV